VDADGGKMRRLADGGKGRRSADHFLLNSCPGNAFAVIAEGLTTKISYPH
jgi:hypothetical protein